MGRNELDNASIRVSCFAFPDCFRSGGKHYFFLCFLVHTDAKDSGNMSDNVQGDRRIVGKRSLDLFFFLCSPGILDCSRVYQILSTGLGGLSGGGLVSKLLLADFVSCLTFDHKAPSTRSTQSR